MPMIAKCGECKFDYPVEILSPLMTTDGAVDQVCGICALALINDLHGTDRETFDGSPIAEGNRQAAIKYREEQA